MNIANGALILVGLFLIIAGLLGGRVEGPGGFVIPAITSRDIRVLFLAIGTIAIVANVVLGVDASGQLHLRTFQTRARTAIAYLATSAVVVIAVAALAQLIPPPVGVPNVYGQRIEDARPKLQEAGYVITAIENVCSNSIRQPGIVRQVLAAAGGAVVVDAPPIDVTPVGQALPTGSALIIKVANGSGC